MNKKTYLLVGAVTQDLQENGQTSPGGTVTYASSMVKKLGWNPIVITTAADSFSPPDFLADIEWRVIPSPHTTTFRNEYYTDGRRQTIGPIASPIQPQAIPKDSLKAHLVHLCPIANELSSDVVELFAATTRVSTPQGWLRQWNESGQVTFAEQPVLADILPRLSSAVISIEDIVGEWAIAERWATHLKLLVVTTGEAGCEIFEHEQRVTVPPRRSQPTNLTGAGDVFAAAFFIRHYETKDARQAARFANVAASMAIERSHPTGVPSRSEIEAYLA